MTDTLVIVAAHNEADRIAATLGALGRAFEGARVWVVDDGSSDDTAAIARAAGATIVRSERAVGKGGAMTHGARALLAHIAGAAQAAVGDRVAGDRVRAADEGVAPDGDPVVVLPDGDPVVVLCDGDLGDSAALLGRLVDAVVGGEGDLAVAAFATKVGGGFGVALGYARRAIRRRCELRMRAPICGQRAMHASALAALLPFAAGFGMEVGMTIDAVHAGLRVVEIEIDLAHRATAKTPSGFVHRGRQLLDIARAQRARR